MLVENLNAKPATEAPTPRPKVDQAIGKQPAEEPAGRESPRAETEVATEVASGRESLARSRLTYDDELSRVFVEIVDPDSGEVVSRFPPEQIVRHIDNLIDQNLVPKSQGTTGFLVDQSA